MPATSGPSRPAVRYYGGKWRLAPWIISFFPPHVCCVEPFMGACSVLLRKPESRFEYLNDADHIVVNFFQVLRGRYDEFMRAIELTPFSKEELERSYEPTDDPVESARRFYVRCWQGHSGARRNRTGWRRQREPARNKTALQDFLDDSHLAAVVARLRKVAIDCQDWSDVLAGYDGPNTLFYVDPPYLHETRGGHDGYPVEFKSRQQHEALVEALTACEGMVVLSGYRSSLYEEKLSDWSAFSTQTRSNKGVATEWVWLNPACAEAQVQRSLFAGGQP